MSASASTSPRFSYQRATRRRIAWRSAYFVASIPSGVLVQRIGYRYGIIVGLLSGFLGGAVDKVLSFFIDMFLTIPFLLAAIFINRAIGLMNRIKPWLRVIERVMGALLLVVGVMLLTGAFSAFSYWLLETFPGLAMLG